MKTGFYEWDNKTYHALKECMNMSALKEFSKSPAHYRAWLTSKHEPTEAMILGSATHTQILEPKKFSSEFTVAPQCDKRTKEGKAMWAEVEKSCKGKTIIKPDQFGAIIGMQKSIKEHATASILLESGKAELSGVFQHEYGFFCKIRPDWLTGDRLCVDLKTTDDASPKAFQRTIMHFKYHWQAAFYLDGLTQITGEQHSDFIIIAVEKKPPYAVAVYHLSEEMISLAQEQLEKIYAQYADCLATDVWPGYDDGIQKMFLPAWMTN